MYTDAQMKPPSSNRPGGSGRPPSDRGPHRGFGGSSQRPSGPGQAGHGGHGQGGHGQGGHGHGGHGQGGQAQAGRGPRGPQPPGHARTGDGPRNNELRGPRPPQRDDRPQREDRPQGKPFLGRPQRDGQERDRPPQRNDFQRSPRPQAHGAPARTPDAPRGTVWLYGLHAVAAALANPARRLRRLLLTEEAEVTLAQRQPPPWPLAHERVERGRLDHLLGNNAAHQGAALLADPLAPPSLQYALDRPGALVVLDQVTDPRNVGAILRCAAAFGAAAVITQDRNAPEETGALAKAASGALETVPLLRAVNIARTLIALKAAGLFVVGLDAGGKAPLSGPGLADRRIALVLGAEGDGLRRLTRETCDEIAGLTMPGAMESLNVSAAAAVALYELTRRV
jgi:23S rRNA (guanosine2251-2'-O)-methyltransferase